MLLAKSEEIAFDEIRWDTPYVEINEDLRDTLDISTTIKLIKHVHQREKEEEIQRLLEDKRISSNFNDDYKDEDMQVPIVTPEGVDFFELEEKIKQATDSFNELKPRAKSLQAQQEPI